ncbi:hypothetical protein Tsubulata_019324 [Turnera subulata]|uniref:F-box domain-containing protein n=1 Tax=Turnera subulata TaxID=218843 RepID=A0A9Q0JNC1_9ROSI|nr:hypothetical protein Tsubulata_019324 [Turnera subulata]
MEEILAMLPIKSIHRFRQLSKSWSSFLVSSEFQKLRNNNSIPPETNLEKILQCSAINDVGDNESGVEEIVVCNPFTGIYRKLQDIDIDRRICACGFGYDSAADDYKVNKLPFFRFGEREWTNGLYLSWEVRVGAGLLLLGGRHV